MRSISIVIPTHNRPRALSSCLHSLALQVGTLPSWDVIVVDDGSSTETKLEIAGAAEKLKSLLRIRLMNQERSGPAAGRNLGVAASSSDLIAFLDDDSLPEEGWLSAIHSRFLTTGADAVKGRVVPFEAGQMAQVVEDEVYDSLNSFATNNVAISRMAFAELGGFDGGFTLPAWEDSEFFFRFNRRGFRLELAPDAVVRHMHETSVRHFQANAMLAGAGLYQFLRKYARRDPRGCWDAICFHRRFPRYLWYLGFERSKEPYKIPGVMKGMYDFYALLGCASRTLGFRSGFAAKLKNDEKERQGG